MKITEIKVVDGVKFALEDWLKRTAEEDVKVIIAAKAKTVTYLAELQMDDGKRVLYAGTKETFEKWRREQVN